MMLFPSKVIEHQHWWLASAVVTLLLLPSSVWWLQVQLKRGAVEETHLKITSQNILYFSFLSFFKKKYTDNINPLNETKCRKPFKKTEHECSPVGQYDKG